MTFYIHYTLNYHFHVHSVLGGTEAGLTLVLTYVGSIVVGDV